MKPEAGSLLQTLLGQAGSGAYPLHMPGHKRNRALLGEPFPGSIDFTEIRGLDDLHAPEGILKDAMDNAASVYGSRASRFLVNGASGGLLAAIAAMTRRGDRVLIARNCHRCVYHALELLALEPVYLLPPTDEAFGVPGSIAPASAKAALERQRDIRLCVLTSPTYDGVISDVESISELLHERGIPLLVDEAHGAHLPFGGGFPKSAMHLGADVVVQGLHKTLPSLTQTAIVHVMSGRVDMGALSRRLLMFETSSPSYILMASIDECVRRMRREGEMRLRAHMSRLVRFSDSMKALQHLRVLSMGNDVLSRHEGFFDFDPSKLLMSTRGTGLTGAALAEILRGAGFDLEMYMGDTALALTSLSDTDEAMDRFASALIRVDEELRFEAMLEGFAPLPLPERKLLIGEALEREGGPVPLQEAAGRISLEYIWAYPPGIPLIVPGEVVSEVLIDCLCRESAKGVRFVSSQGALPEALCVC